MSKGRTNSPNIGFRFSMTEKIQKLITKTRKHESTKNKNGEESEYTSQNAGSWLLGISVLPFSSLYRKEHPS
jgi:hypothetical protein